MAESTRTDSAERRNQSTNASREGAPGALNEIHVEGERWYNYVVSNVLTGIVDEERCERSRSGRIKKLVFRADRLPENSQIFKVPETQLVSIYLNEGAGESLASMVEDHDLEAGDMTEIWDSESA